CIVRMDGALDERFQPARARLVRIGYVKPEKVHHPLVEEDRFAVPSEPPDQARNHIDELRGLPLAIAQRLDGLLVNVDVKRDAEPSGDTTVTVMRGSCRGASPDIAAAGAPKAKFNIELIAGLQAVTPRGGDPVIIVGMKQSLPGRVALVQRSVQIV